MHNIPFKLLVLVSVTLFLIFAGLGIRQGILMRNAKGQAQHHFDLLQEAIVACAKSEPESEVCQNRAFQKKQFDQQVLSIDQHRSLTLLFVTFSVFIPGVAWLFYFLTGSIFKDNNL